MLINTLTTHLSRRRCRSSQGNEFAGGPLRQESQMGHPLYRNLKYFENYGENWVIFVK